MTRRSLQHLFMFPISAITAPVIHSAHATLQERRIDPEEDERTERINLNTAFQRPMADVFDTHSKGHWTFTAEASTVLTTTMLAQGSSGVRFAAGPIVTPKHDAAYWDAATAGFNFSEADQVPPAQFNRVLWTGLMGSKPYPVPRGDR